MAGPQAGFLPAKQNPYRAALAFNLAMITIGTKSGNTINVAVQLKDARGRNTVGPAVIAAYLSDNADGSTLTATATTSAEMLWKGGFPGIGFKIDPQFLSKSDGSFDVNVIQTVGSTTYYLVLVLHDGSILLSGAITF